MTHDFKIQETWEGDGTGGVMFQLPNRGSVFVSRWSGRGDPPNATEQDWIDARQIVAAIEHAIENGVFS